MSLFTLNVQSTKPDTSTNHSGKAFMAKEMARANCVGFCRCQVSQRQEAQSDPKRWYYRASLSTQQEHFPFSLRERTLLQDGPPSQEALSLSPASPSSARPPSGFGVWLLGLISAPSDSRSFLTASVFGNPSVQTSFPSPQLTCLLTLLVSVKTLFLQELFFQLTKAHPAYISSPNLGCTLQPPTYTGLTYFNI